MHLLETAQWATRKAGDKVIARAGSVLTAALAARLREPRRGALERRLQAVTQAAVPALSARCSKLPLLAAELASAARADATGVLSAHYEQVLAEADRVIGGTVALFGPLTSRLREDEDWHRDPRGSYLWPADLPSAKVPLCPGEGAEVRRVWELGRCHFFVTLAQAYALTARPCYRTTLETLARAFSTANPFGLGVHWTCPMEIALRLCNLVMAIEIVLRSGGVFSPGFLEGALQDCYLAALAIRWNREWWGGYTNNHYLCDLLGLSVAATLFPRRRASWLARELRRELGKQFSAAGFNLECSVTYHRFACEVLFYALRALPEERALVEGCQRALASSVTLMRADGTLPFVGDNDDSHVLRLTRRGSNDFSHFPALHWLLGGEPLATALPDRGQAEVLWLEGPRRLHEYLARPQATRRRSLGWSPGLGVYTAEGGSWRFELVCREHNSGHAHGDLLALTATYRGLDVLVDPGNAVYTSDMQARARYRSSRYHSTVTIDGEELLSFPRRGPLARRAFGNPPAVSCQGAMELRAERVRVEGTHLAYARQGVRVSRSVEIDPARDLLAIEDRFEALAAEQRGPAAVTIDWAFHLGPVEVTRCTADLVELRVGPHQLLLRQHGSGEFSLSPAERSPAFGVSLPTQLVSLRAHTSLPFAARFELGALA